MLDETHAYPFLSGRDLVHAVTCREPYEVDARRQQPRPHVVAFDYGIKRSILRHLTRVGCRVTVVPAQWTPRQVLALDPDGVFLSNGPGDPAPVEYAVECIRGLLGRVPIFGICLGHQLIWPSRWVCRPTSSSSATGASTTRSRTTERGVIEITSQNHGFAVTPPPAVTKARERGARPVLARARSAGGRHRVRPAAVTHLNLNDGTVEGLRLLDVPAFCVQYHPEAGPGPHDSLYLFEQFLAAMGATAPR